MIPVNSIAHFYHDKCRKSHCHWLGMVEYLAFYSRVHPWLGNTMWVVSLHTTQTIYIKSIETYYLTNIKKVPFFQFLDFKSSWNIILKMGCVKNVWRIYIVWVYVCEVNQVKYMMWVAIFVDLGHVWKVLYIRVNVSTNDWEWNWCIHS